MGMIENFEQMLAAGQDNPLMRYTLGNEYLKAGQPGEALPHLQEAVRQDPGYSAAWKLCGKALVALERNDEAIGVYERGIAAAEDKGDKQAAREMQVFLKRLLKAGDR